MTKVRWGVSGLLLILVAVLVLGSVLARYTRSEVLDTDRYVATVGPLASDPAVQDAVGDRISGIILDRIDLDALTTEALTSLTENLPRGSGIIVGFSPVLAKQAEDFVREAVDSMVASDRFASLWTTANRAAHRTLVAVATGEIGGRAVQVDESGTVSVPLQPFVEAARDRLIERGFTFADRISDTDAEFVLLQSDNLASSQRAVRALDAAATWLPWGSLIAAAGAVLIAPRGGRLRAVSLAGVAVAVAMSVLALALVIVRWMYLDDLSAQAFSPLAAGAVVDAFAGPLRTTLVWVFLGGVVVAVGARLIGLRELRTDAGG
ncbi:hypothetical protein ERC79_14055 [Rhodococcus sp. ABRD24]|uniref:hypothetical protein n=1 Tax=Rhodococcus sp. ABRD24 TaxID=2507582 RepID=UPI00103AF970|nr:hypothetical protein [Rhodococcus sp. ABRD24]QBJ96949.1 hypothetical protein ERC79_14055 [Rhodococcus sp. ABRD24]